MSLKFFFINVLTIRFMVSLLVINTIINNAFKNQTVTRISLLEK